MISPATSVTVSLQPSLLLLMVFIDTTKLLIIILFRWQVIVLKKQTQEKS
jgi:hypothetical protein